MTLVTTEYISGKEMEMLGIVKGTAVTLVADGADEEEAIDTLVSLINSDFSE